MSTTELLVVAGEASGDLHGARLLAHLRKSEPDLRAFGLGGREMVADGFEAVADSAEISVVGITEVLKILRRARQIFRQLLDEVERRGATRAVLIDFPDFNLRLAKQLHRRGVRVVYYISPQLWAWRKGRVKTIAANVDRMLVLFPFELAFYRSHDVDAVHVGHPLVDEIQPPALQAWDRPPVEGEPFRVALMPGSRPSEVRALLPPLLQAGRLLAQRMPVTLRLIQAPTLPATLVDQLVEEGGVEVERVRADRFQAIADCHLAICASGTATLEVGLLGTPMVVVYRLSRGSYWLGRLLVDLPHFSMVNLVLGTGVVPELLQDEVRPRRIADEVAELLDSPAAIDTMRRGLAELRPRLGSGGASARAAAEIAECLQIGDGAE